MRFTTYAFSAASAFAAVSSALPASGTKGEGFSSSMSSMPTPTPTPFLGLPIDTSVLGLKNRRANAGVEVRDAGVVAEQPARRQFEELEAALGMPDDTPSTGITRRQFEDVAAALAVPADTSSTPSIVRRQLESAQFNPCMSFTGDSICTYLCSSSQQGKGTCQKASETSELECVCENPTKEEEPKEEPKTEEPKEEEPKEEPASAALV